MKVSERPRADAPPRCQCESQNEAMDVDDDDDGDDAEDDDNDDVGYGDGGGSNGGDCDGGVSQRLPQLSVSVACHGTLHEACEDGALTIALPSDFHAFHQAQGASGKSIGHVTCQG